MHSPSPPSIATVETERTIHSVGSRVLGAAIGRVVNPIVGLVDVDGVARRIDVNAVLKRVDWNEILQDIEWDVVVDEIDFDAILERVDVDKIVQRVDVNALLERSNLKRILARSTRGLCSLVLNSFRALCIKIDQIVQRAGRCAYCCYCCPQQRHWTLPPLPTVTPIAKKKKRNEDRKFRQSLRCPTKATHLATAVQGRNAGTFSRFLAFAIDKGLAIAFTALLLVIIFACIDLVPSSKPSEEEFSQAAIILDKNMTAEELDMFLSEEGELSKGQRNLLVVLVIASTYFLIAFHFDAIFLAAVGRTVGKIIMGLLVVYSRGGKVGHIRFIQAVGRSFLGNIGLNVIGAFVSLNREDRRGICDILCHTTVIYAWDAKSYRLASEEMAQEMPFGDLELYFDVFDGGDEAYDSVQETVMKSTKRKLEARNRSRVKTRVISVPANV